MNPWTSEDGDEIDRRWFLRCMAWAGTGVLYETFKSSVLDSGETYEHTFVDPGTYRYFCSIHPRMTGKVVVL